VSVVAVHPPYRLRRFDSGEVRCAGTLQDCTACYHEVLDRGWHAGVYRSRVAALTEAAALIPERWDALRGTWVTDHSLDELRVQHGLVAV
jgi:hypothetical protein